MSGPAIEMSKAPRVCLVFQLPCRLLPQGQALHTFLRYLRVTVTSIHRTSKCKTITPHSNQGLRTPGHMVELHWQQLTSAPVKKTLGVSLLFDSGHSRVRAHPPPSSLLIAVKPCNGDNIVTAPLY
jgi:hypothetical protein